MQKSNIALIISIAAFGMAIAAWMRNSPPALSAAIPVVEPAAPVVRPMTSDPSRSTSFWPASLPENRMAPAPAGSSSQGGEAPGSSTSPGRVAGSSVAVLPRKKAASVTIVAEGGGLPRSVPSNTPLTVELDPGVQVPVALLESDEELPPAQAAAKKDIENTFTREINAAVASSTDPAAVEAAWKEARDQANLRYQLLFGDGSFHQAAINAGLDAVTPP